MYPYPYPYYVGALPSLPPLERHERELYAIVDAVRSLFVAANGRQPSEVEVGDFLILLALKQIGIKGGLNKSQLWSHVQQLLREAWAES